MTFVVEIESAEQLDHAMDRITSVPALLNARHLSRTVRRILSVPPALFLICISPPTSHGRRNAEARSPR